MNQTLENFKRSDRKSLQNAARAWLLRTNDPAGIEAWVDFHLSPIFKMHSERWGDAGANWRSHILHSFYARTYIEEYFWNYWNCKLEGWSDFKNPVMRLAISDYRFLKRVATFAGALIASEKILKVVDRNTIVVLRKELGEEVLHFIRIHASHLDSMIPAKCRLKTWLPSDPVLAVLNAGWMLITCASALLPTHEWRSFLNRLPSSIEKEWHQYKFSLEDFRMSWECLQALLDIIRKLNVK